MATLADWLIPDTYKTDSDLFIDMSPVIQPELDLGLPHGIILIMGQFTPAPFACKCGQAWSRAHFLIKHLIDAREGIET